MTTAFAMNVYRPVRGIVYEAQEVLRLFLRRRFARFERQVEVLQSQFSGPLTLLGYVIPAQVDDRFHSLRFQSRELRLVWL